MTDVVTLGETMLVARAERVGPLRAGDPATLSWAGAESTVAVGLARLGHSVTWVGCVGDDPAGAMVLAGLRGEGVDTTHVRVLGDRPTGVMVRERRTADRVRVGYARARSAGAALQPEHLPDGLVESARVLHVTGVTAALGEGPRAAVRHAVDRARAAGVTVTLDVNHRARLWSHEEAARELRPLVARCDVVVAGEGELAALGCAPDPVGAAEELLEAGCSVVVVTRGAAGATAATPAGTVTVPAVPVTVLDPVGAGDAFVAGYLSAHLDGADLPGRLARAAACGAFAVSVPGDWEGLPRRDELGLLSGLDVVR